MFSSGSVDGAKIRSIQKRARFAAERKNIARYLYEVISFIKGFNFMYY
jgi:hypothetical protein